MPGSANYAVTGRDGLRGELLDTPPFTDAVRPVRIRLSDGREMEVASSELIQQSDGSYYLPLSASELPPPSALPSQGTSIPVVAEELDVSKRSVATGSVRVQKRLIGHDELVDMPLMREDVDVRRVLIDRDIDSVPLMREEAGTIIVPLVEEVLVVEKRLRLREEVHITRRRTEERHQENVTLLREEVEVSRTGTDGVTRIQPVATSEPVVAASQPAVLPAEEAPRPGFIRRNRIIKEN